VARDWKQVFDQTKPVYGDVLEIGSGTGQLTWGLAHRFPFMSVSACDISTKFLQKAAGVVGESKVPVRYHACDANFLPFRDGSFDLVVGHSVLHHFIDYKKIIHRLSKLLRPGGQAIFYEPVLQGKMIIACLADMMRRIERRTKWGVLTEQDDERINHMTRHIMKAKWIGDNRERLEKMEDKYVFDIEEMRSLAHEAGFSSLQHINQELPEKGFIHYVNQHLLMEGIAPKKIQQFEFVTNSYMSTMGEMFPNNIATPMGYFIFKK
jgi:ubiquinone/menaquinone biosynthesis C-methylase UbiE